MSKLIHCTLTGVDDKTDLQHLLEMNEVYPFVEFGVLYSEKKMGSGRYPSMDTLDRIVELLDSDITRPSFALHVCGRAVTDLMNNDGRVSEIADSFDRIQINFRSENFSISQIRGLMYSRGHQEIITQHNSANRNLWRALSGITNHQVLFDSSGGRGLAPEHWPIPLRGVECGYSGGLGRDNIEKELKSIIQAAHGFDFWVDMETKLRIDDVFSLVECEAVLKIIADSGVVIKG